MSCSNPGESLTCAVESHASETLGARKTAQGPMKRLFIFVRFIAVALLAFECGSAVFAQGEKTDLSGNKETSRSGFTGAGAGGSRTTAAKPGGADGLGNPLLGGERHPLYRLRPSDVVEISFTVAPEFNQTLTVQPDGYVMLKDAGMVDVQGLNLGGVQRGGAESVPGISARSAGGGGAEGIRAAVLHRRRRSRQAGKVRTALGYDGSGGGADCGRA